ncbi:lipid IV(A) 3-deoxy-D-manno-octulosonic acid transferase [Helicobacter sp. faydin-H17]|uniref:lipid IV(A) 3-deoxy-D-manno-octulosonic acid transferase n=1 Tax=Helicobacter kayseriensis TaxID=2905877 RepID=UPI001E333983|nr:lipid IV(A) 3-deoxy-D-manno-octulosonic acid transferase [Helicobacter kayseriensis]MCE3047107.1 lipid IV(A) 3-deoxy-D-manno-octulosonic acid transferase [Helicobacter kayseriensis]
MKSLIRFPIFYFLLCCLAFCLAIPLLLYLSFKNKYKDSIPARFFLRRIRLRFYPTYWFHACSLGESKSYEPILEALLDQEHQARILLTCTTSTGFKYLSSLSQKYPQNLRVAYLPFEIFLPLWLPYLKNLKTLVVTEAELWKMLFWVAKVSNAYTLLVNARISDSSLKSYLLLSFFYRSLFSLIDQTLAQLPIDQERLQILGAKNIEVFGNLKIFSTPSISFHYSKNTPIILGASTHQGEEELILNSFISSKAKAKLLIAPRHPERFKQVQDTLRGICQKHSLSFSNFRESWGDVVLVNALGELNNLYAIADCVILGGSFEKIGGHNPIEPAFFQAPILSGKYFYNQKALYALVENILIITPQELPQTLASFDTLPKTKIKNHQHKMQHLIAIIQRTNQWKKPINS